MQKLILHIFSILAIAAVISCNNSNKSKEESNPGNNQTNKEPGLKGDYCFLKAYNRDTTDIKIRVLSDDDIRGEMIRQPWEKDGAAGTLSGKMISANEMELLYDYMIEGSKQTETIIMKIENGKLHIKTGELTDIKNDGNLTYKDKATTEYTETLEEVPCK